MANTLTDEDIRNRRAAGVQESIPLLRTAVIAQGNGYPIPKDVLAALIVIEERDVHLRGQQAIAAKQQPPVRPDWMDVKSPPGEFKPPKP